LVFIDTLRHDHLGLHGYERDTSPNLDAFAAQSAVFEQARSVAPWTLPSTRTVLTGDEPEMWGKRPTLPALLAAQGWGTGAFIANVYLSSNFDMHKQWGLYTGINWALAGEQVERALNFVKKHPDRPVAVMLHLMDTHLPYNEPVHLRSLFTSDEPAPLKDGFLRSQVLKLNGPGNEDARQYVIDRYDSSIRYVDTELKRLLDTVGPNDTVVIWSDHGEEFWEHGSFEHGHTLYDEVLRVPLIIKSPRLAPRRIDAPVSLMDVVPTVLEALHLPPSPTIRGLSLIPAMQGNKASLSALRDRDQSFGRPLYGTEQWGVLSAGMKYISDAGWESVYDLTTDPGESTDLVEDGDVDNLPALRARMGEALDRPTREVIRVYPARQRSAKRLKIVLHVPGGARSAWVGDDATLRSEATVKIDGERVTATWAGGKTGSREVFVEPNEPWPEVMEGLRIDLSAGKAKASLNAVKDPTVVPTGRRQDLFDIRLGGREIEVNLSILPGPLVQGKAVEGFNKENEAALKALGYID
jgi:arylsulfatase A-like enzyme